MKWVSYFFFYTYVGLVVLAGFWGAFINPYFDMRLLFHLDPYELSEYSRVNMLSQYRFLRAIELGFGIFSIVFLKQIFSERPFNTLFLSIMGLGVLARVLSIAIDGMPSPLFMFFMIYEFVGLLIIYLHTKKEVLIHAG